MGISFKKLSKYGRLSSEKKDPGLTDYNNYEMTLKERIFYILLAAAAIYITGFIFYRSHLFSMLLCPLAILYPKVKRKDIIAKRKNELNIQFKDMLYSLSSSLSAGRPVELSFREVLRDLAIIYPDTDTMIIKEVEFIARRIEMNETVESALSDFAHRAHIEDIDNFVDVFHICKRAGGNLIEIIKNASNIINDKIEIKQEINTMLAEKRFERKILNVLPVLMIVLISISAADYIEPVFSTFQGRIVISFSVILLAVAYLISKKIMEIKV